MCRLVRVLEDIDEWQGVVFRSVGAKKVWEAKSLYKHLIEI